MTSANHVMEENFIRGVWRRNSSLLCDRADVALARVLLVVLHIKTTLAPALLHRQRRSGDIQILTQCLASLLLLISISWWWFLRHRNVVNFDISLLLFKWKFSCDVVWPWLSDLLVKARRDLLGELAQELFHSARRLATLLSLRCFD